MRLYLQILPRDEDDHAPLDHPPPPPLLPGRKRCFCCGRTLGRQQRARHREIFLEEAEARFAAQANAALELGFQAEDSELVDDGMRMDNAEMEDWGDAAPNGPEEFVDPFAGLALDAGHDAGHDAGDDAGPDAGHDDPPPAPDQVEPFGDVIRNPPVRIDDWPEPGSEDEEELEDFEDFGDEGPGDDAEQDPAYVEHDVDPNQIGPNFLDELDMPDAQLREMMREDLGDLADEEIDELYGTHVTPKDKMMLRFLATRL
ncbi:hypothetical protein FRC07_013512, partial [Ceratobasidium sp. 392]